MNCYKKTIRIPACIKSEDDLFCRLKRGEVFWYGALKIHYDESLNEPFRVEHLPLSAPVAECFNLFEVKDTVDVPVFSDCEQREIDELELEIAERSQTLASMQGVYR